MTTLTEDTCHFIKDFLIQKGLYSESEESSTNTWRISPEPYYLSPEDVNFFRRLGPHLLKFYQSLDKIYQLSVKGKLPEWISWYLDLGKPADLIQYCRMKRLRRELPRIIRPDIIISEKGFRVTELDSVPGGFGLMSALMPLYSGSGHNVLGEDLGGIPDLFARMMDSVYEGKNATLAIVVSDEAGDYLNEMKYLGELLREKGIIAFVGHPRDLIFREEGLYFNSSEGEVPIDVLYRFFELFDLKNIPKMELIMYCQKKGKVKITPPFKPHLEEKLVFFLFHHPELKAIWEKNLGTETFTLLSHLIPKTWLLDNRELPPYSVIPGLTIQGKPVRLWRELMDLTQKERELVIKTSGFSPKAWGGRGVTIGHDVSLEVWQKTLQESLRQFDQEPSILQEFHKGKRVTVSYFNHDTRELKQMDSRVRLTPYYFIIGENAELGGILATLCPHNKKKIHGMTEAVMVPCAVNGSVD